MKKENFDKLSTDHKWIIVHEYTDLLRSAVSNRMALLPNVAILSVGLLVVATFNQNILANLSYPIVVVLSLLLIIIPLSLYLYNEDQKTLANKSKAELERLNGPIPEGQDGVRGWLTARMPDICIYILALGTIYLITLNE